MLRPETLPVVSVTTNNNKEIKRKKKKKKKQTDLFVSVTEYKFQLLTPLPENTD